MNKLKTIASFMVSTMLFCSAASAKVNSDSIPASTAVPEVACQHMQNLVDLGIVGCVKSFV